MYSEPGLTGNFYTWLQQLDQQRADEAQKQGCRCGERLHRANYPRKPRGGPPDLDPAYEQRLSLCCATEGCRRRVTPALMPGIGWDTGI